MPIPDELALSHADIPPTVIKIRVNHPRNSLYLMVQFIKFVARKSIITRILLKQKRCKKEGQDPQTMGLSEGLS